MKRCHALVVAVLLALPAVAPADDGIPAKTLADIKAATVFIKLETTRAAGSGSGFVVQVDKDTVLVVTNEHVVRPPAAAGPVRKLDVVFRSGKAKEEAAYAAEVLAADANRDLAVLRVKKVVNPPKPIDLTVKAEASETATVYAVGFPFGDALATTDGNPAVTISKTSVSSLREDDQGELAVVQLEGGINPGNSGGPVLDSKGRLVGISVAKLRGTNIGFALPPNELTKMLHGRVGASGVRVVSVDKDTAEVEFTLEFIDPLEKVASATIRLVKSDAAAPIPAKRGDIPALTGGTTHEIKLSGQKGSIKLKLPVAKHQMQITYTNEGRKDIHTSVVVQDVPTLARRGGGGGPTTPDPRPNPNLPKPVNPLPGAEKVVGDLKVKSVEVSTEPAQFERGKSNEPAPACLTWTADAKGFYAIDRGADTVRRFSYPDLKEEAKLSVGKEVLWLNLSKEGLVLTVTGEQEAWVIDPITLKKKDAFPINKATRVLSAPSLSVAYVIDVSGVHHGCTLRVIDLKTGKLLKEYEPKDLGKQAAFFTPVLSDDGKHLFTTDVSTLRLIHLATDNEKITFVAACEGLTYGAYVQPVVSTDSKLVCSPCGAGNQSLKSKKASGYSTFVFTTENLEEPIAELKTGAYPAAVGFDTKTGLIFAHNHQDQLILLDREGTKLKSYHLGDGSPRQFLVHPDGGKLLVLVPGGTLGKAATVYSVELPPKK